MGGAGAQPQGYGHRRASLSSIRKVDALYEQARALPVDVLGPNMARLSREHHRHLGMVTAQGRPPSTAPLSRSAKRAPSWVILGEYEYATGNYETISIVAPAPEFFGPAPGDLHWNGRDGWTDANTGQLVAVLRHTVNSGQNELLIDALSLKNWLAAEEQSLVWIENTGKDVYRDMGGGDTYPGALTRSQAHAWTPGSAPQTTTPGWQRIPARGE